MPQQAKVEEFLVQGADVASGKFEEIVKADAEIVNFKAVAKDVATVQMSSDRAELLKKQFGAGLVIERNEQLKLP